MAQLFLLLVLFSSLGENSTNSTSSPETNIYHCSLVYKKRPNGTNKTTA